MRMLSMRCFATAICLLLANSQVSVAFLQPHAPHRHATIDTRRNSIFDTVSSIGGLAPSRPILDGNKAMLKSLLEGTYLEQSLDNISCCYKASRDGWSAIDFHTCSDNQGSGLVLARTRTGVTFGGFNPNGWRSTDDYFLSNAAFLWYAPASLVGGSKIVKCPIYQGSNAAVYDYATGGPCFGTGDLQIGEPKAAIMGGFAGPDMENVAASAGDLKTGRCSFAGAYDFSKGWPIRGRFSLVEVEVYCIDGAAKGRKSFW